MKELASLWDSLPHPQLLVVGDLMLDRYTVGEAERISPEAPVIVLRGECEDVRPGGAANVASFLSGLEADVALVGVVGNDGDGRMLRRMIDDLQVNATGVLNVDDRPTTSKQRFVGRTAMKNPQQLLRVDHESRDPITEVVETRLKDFIGDQLHKCDAVLISDYAKGVLTPSLLHWLVDAAWRADRPTLIDPCRDVNYDRYSGATLIAPNRVAAQAVSGRVLNTPETILLAAEELRRRLQIDAAVITLDRDGLAYAAAGARGLVPCRPRTICDVTGAGDMVLAILGLGYAAGWPLLQSLELANTAAGLEVERFGVEPISREEIAVELCGPSHDKLVSLNRMAQLAAAHRRAGRTIVVTNGCFDLLHVGHVALLEEAAQMGDVLIVAINSDASVQRLKGADRPVIAEQDRARMLAALECVHHVLIFDEDTPHRLLHAVRPDVLVKGGTTGEIVGREFVESYGGRVCQTARIGDWSTTTLVQRMRKQVTPIPEEVA